MAMPARQQECYTREEYLVREEVAEYKSEYYDGEIVAMSGGSRNHSVICLNVNRRVAEALDSRDDCVGFESNMKLDIPKHNLFVYPDMMVVCGDIEFSEERQDSILNPLLLFEVVASETEEHDIVKKFKAYLEIPSVQEYVMISEEELQVQTYFRQSEKSWLYTMADGLDATILFHSIGHEFALKEIYQKVDWQHAERDKSVKQ